MFFSISQPNTIALPPGVQIPPGAQLVRNEQGQLVFVIQQPAVTSAATGHRMFVRVGITHSFILSVHTASF